MLWAPDVDDWCHFSSHFWRRASESSKTQVRSSCRIKLISLLYYRIIYNPATAPSANPFGWPPMRRIGEIVCAIGGANETPWGELCWCSTDFWYYSYCRKSTGREFFVPARTLIGVNSLTSKSVPAGTKNYCSEGFLLAKHKHTNIPTMMKPFSPPAAWFWWTSVHHPREPTRKGLDEASVEGF